MFALARCAACGSAVTLGPAPPDAHATGAYAARDPRLARLAAPVLERFDRRRLALLQPYLAPGAAVLDVGAGRGRWWPGRPEPGTRRTGSSPRGAAWRRRRGRAWRSSGQAGRTP
jgi:hypothetical protein